MTYLEAIKTIGLSDLLNAYNLEAKLRTHDAYEIGIFYYKGSDGNV